MPQHPEDKKHPTTDAGPDTKKIKDNQHIIILELWKEFFSHIIMSLTYKANSSTRISPPLIFTLLSNGTGQLHQRIQWLLSA